MSVCGENSVCRCKSGFNQVEVVRQLHTEANAGCYLPRQRSVPAVGQNSAVAQPAAPLHTPPALQHSSTADSSTPPG